MSAALALELACRARLTPEFCAPDTALPKNRKFAKRVTAAKAGKNRIRTGIVVLSHLEVQKKVRLHDDQSSNNYLNPVWTSLIEPGLIQIPGSRSRPGARDAGGGDR